MTVQYNPALSMYTCTLAKPVLYGTISTRNISVITHISFIMDM